MSDSGRQKASQLSEVQAARDAARLAQKYDLKRLAWVNERTLEEDFPRVHAILMRGRQKIHWPGEDHGFDGHESLSKVFRAIMRLPPSIEHEEQNSGAALWLLANRALKAQSRPQWPAKTWDRLWMLAVEDHREEEDEKELGKPGRKETQMTLEVRRIRKALNVAKSRAYQIYEDGTAILDQRMKLAEEFKHDPELNFAGAWELDFGGSYGGPRRASTAFRDYVLSESDDFEGDVCAALAVLKRVYIRGELPSNFLDFRTFVDAMASLDLSLKVALRLWDRANDYGKRQRIGN